MNLTEITPVQVSSDILIKRDDLFQPLDIINVNGTKLRECIVLLENNIERCKNFGVITGTSIYSPQSIIVASACYILGIKCTCIFGGTTIKRLHELNLYNALTKLGAKIEIPCKGGRTSILQSYINKRIQNSGEFCVKYGINIMNKEVLETAVSEQIQNIPDVKNICLVCGSGITTIGILLGLQKYKPCIDNIYLFGTAPNREKLLQSYFNNLIRRNDYVKKIKYVDLHSEKGFVYEKKIYKEVDGIKLHPQYEAKAFERMGELNLVNKDTLFYIIGQEINKEDI